MKKYFYLWKYFRNIVFFSIFCLHFLQILAEVSICSFWYSIVFEIWKITFNNSIFVFTGIGETITARLLKLGAHVYAIGRDQSKLTAAARPNLTPVCVDVGDWNAYEKIKALGPVHGLVNNAGVAFIESFFDMTQEGWDKYVFQNVFLIYLGRKSSKSNFFKLNILYRYLPFY